MSDPKRPFDPRLPRRSFVQGAVSLPVVATVGLGATGCAANVPSQTIAYGDEESIHVFNVNRQGAWHGPERVQLWCTVGAEDELETFQTRDYIPHHLEVDRVEAEAVEVLSKKNELSV